jgi:hypothetical protein
MELHRYCKHLLFPLFPLMLLQSGACSGTSSEALAPSPTTSDPAPVVQLVNDPVVLLLPDLLQDRSAAELLRRRLSNLSRSLRGGDVDAVTRDLGVARDAVAYLREQQTGDSADLVPLSSIELILLRIEQLVDAPAGMETVVATPTTGRT